MLGNKEYRESEVVYLTNPTTKKFEGHYSMYFNSFYTSWNYPIQY